MNTCHAYRSERAAATRRGHREQKGMKCLDCHEVMEWNSEFKVWECVPCDQCFDDDENWQFKE